MGGWPRAMGFSHATRALDSTSGGTTRRYVAEQSEQKPAAGPDCAITRYPMFLSRGLMFVYAMYSRPRQWNRTLLPRDREEKGELNRHETSK
jgi:hypothetical protein